MLQFLLYIVFVWKHMCLVYYTHPGAFWHKKSIYTQGQKCIYDKELLTHRGYSDNTFSQMSESPGYAQGGGALGIHID